MTNTEINTFAEDLATTMVTGFGVQTAVLVLLRAARYIHQHHAKEGITWSSALRQLADDAEGL